MTDVLRAGFAASLALAVVFGGMMRPAAAATAYDFSFETIDGKPMPLSQYKGKTVLVVNTASFCGFTPQYTQLEAVWKKYQAKGLVVLGVPSNDFGAQEPGTAKEIQDFCESKYDVDFPLASKVVVKGAQAHPFYQWAAEKLGDANAPRWNFHKYLVNSKGELVAAFGSKITPDSKDVIAAIDQSLAAK